ncbi:hypothetical protein Hypma_000025 [Hypsizygus marmoreus]|uniref:Uncharacterized protein n=1 Tax=Hypsizygus marmoreus TaxID=39966 RepID=A0A369KCC4_HYPMA|nr:hypothetical protein Hypma_000025 [Hypsizygus marmoreus]
MSPSSPPPGVQVQAQQEYHFQLQPLAFVDSRLPVPRQPPHTSHHTHMLVDVETSLNFEDSHVIALSLLPPTTASWPNARHDPQMRRANTNTHLHQIPSRAVPARNASPTSLLPSPLSLYCTQAPNSDSNRPPPITSSS